MLDALRLPLSVEKYDLVFMDPPYYNDYVSKSLKGLIVRQYLEEGAIIAIEMEKRGSLEIPASMLVVKEKIYGNNKLIILRYEQS